MGKRIVIWILLGIFSLGGTAWAADKKSPCAGPCTRGGYLMGELRGPAKEYCQEIRPESKTCKKMRRLLRRFREKFQELRAELRAEIHNYCEKHAQTDFCKELAHLPCPDCKKFKKKRALEGC